MAVAAPVRQLMTNDEFLDWRLGREGVWELIDGVPTLKFDENLSVIADASRTQARVASNIVAALGHRLSDGERRPFVSERPVRTTANRMRQPEVSIECARDCDGDLKAAEPTVLIEVLSGTTSDFDLLLRTHEYQQLQTVKQIALLELARAEALLLTRQASEDWLLEDVVGLEQALPLYTIDVSLPLSEAYAGVDLT